MDKDNTKLLLNIEDNHIKITKGWKASGVLRFKGILDYRPKACPHCGILNDGQIIDFGWRKTIFRFSQLQGNCVLLELKRHNFECTECHRHFLAQTTLVPKNCNISNPTRQECLEKFTDTASLKHIANELNTSDSFVGRQLMRAERDFQPNYHYLPKILLMDEIKSTKSATNGMSFEFMDAEKH